MEAAQDGVDFLLGIVRIEIERVHDEVQDDEQFVAHRRELLERAVRVEKGLQHFAYILFLVVFRDIRRTLAFELTPRQGLDCLLIQFVDSVCFANNA